MTDNATSAPKPGQTLAGKYLVEQVLGIGGMGVVVAAKHLQLDQKVAIKYLLPEALQNPEVVERFAREARSAAKIRGEHVARVIDVGKFDDGAPYMIMEHLEGHDLAKHLADNGPLPVPDTVRWLLETCEALAEAHAAKIVHRDLKPSNLFLAEQPDKTIIVKVLDFGISKTGDATSAALTKTSALMGTAYYMSPEQLTNPKGVDHRSDIWSLGVILYELLAGRPPFIGESVPEIIGAILHNQPDELRTLRPQIPQALEQVIAKCMQSKADARYQNVAALAAALGAFARVEDRASIDITARVLGERPSSPSVLASSVATVLAPASDVVSTVQAAQAQAAAALAKATEGSDAAAAEGAPGGVTRASSTGEATGDAPAVAAVTTHGMSSSAITTRPKRSGVTMIAAVAAVALAIGGTVAGIKLAGGHDDGPPSQATGLVPGSATVVEATAQPSLAPAPPAPDPMPAASASASASPEAHAPAAAATAPTTTPRGTGKAVTVKTAATVAAARPSAAPAATPTTAPTASVSKNPLQMGIK